MNTVAICCLVLLACLGRCACAEEAEEMPEPIIHHGKPVNITEVPFMARLQLANVKLSCAAVIVHERFLLSAGHCYNPNATVRVGSDNLNDGSGEDYTIEKMFVHPKCNLQKGGYDLLVIKLTKNITLSERVQPIKMADPDIEIEDGAMMDTIGFGHTENGTVSDQLLKIDVPVYNQKQCKKYMKRTIKKKVKKDTICAGGVGYEVCGGDNGGPLRYNNMVVGLTSFIARPCTPNNPAVFARVSVMRPFIDEIIKSNLGNHTII